MRAVFDTCVLVPTFLRAVLLTCAETCNVEFIVSPHILEEWTRAAKTPFQRLESEIAVAQFRQKFAIAIRPDPLSLVQFWLPDSDDIHVLAAAITSSADLIITLNASDFPRNILAEEDLTRSDPDSFLCDLYQTHPAQVTTTADQVLARARQETGKDWTREQLLKKAGLSNLAKNFNK